MCAVLLLAGSLWGAALGEAEIQELVGRLDAPRFADRQGATNRLSELGPAAFEPLSKVIESGSQEARERGLGILRDHFRSSEASIREAAERTLKKIAEGTSLAAAQAQEILTPPSPTIDPRQAQLQALMAQRAIMQAQVIGGRVRIAGQVPAILPAMPAAPALPIGPGVNRTITVRSNNRRVQIETRGDGIKIEIEETKDGKTTTEKIEAKNAEELKKNHPEAYKLFEQYAGGAARRALPAPAADPFGVPAPPAPNAPNAPADPFGARPRIALPPDAAGALKQRLQELEKQIEQAKQAGGNETELKTMEARKQSYERILERIEQR